VVGEEHVLRGELGRAVWVQRAGQAGLGRRQLLRLAVDRAAGRCEKEAADRARRAGGFEQVERADDVRFRIGNRLAQAAAHVGQRGLVADDRRALVRKQVHEGRGVTDIRLIEASRGVQVGALTGGQVVDDGNRVAGGEEGIDDVRADEPGPAGEEDVFWHG